MAVDIINQIPGSFYTQIESKKWSDRKEALEIIEKATSVPAIQNADFNELVSLLKKIIAKDSNIVVVTLAAKCLCQLAQGLRTNFAPHSNSCLKVIYEKFKEKKPNVISVLRDTADAAFIGTSLENIFEDIIQFLDNKNPQIKSEIALFLARIFSNYPAQVMNKKLLRPLINALIKTLSDMDVTVRDSSAMAIGTAMKVTGENIMMPLIADVEPIKITKIKEFCEKAEIMTAPTNGQSDAAAPDVVEQAATVVASNGVADDDEDDEDFVYDSLIAVDITNQIPASFYTQMESKKWSDRKEALEIIERATSVPKIQNADFNELVSLLKKTIAKDSNIVVVASAAKCLCQLAQGLRTNFGVHSNSCLKVIFEKFKEKKPNVISVLREAADAAFIGTNLESIFEEIILFLDNKNPQIKSEMELFLARAFSKYPAQVMNKKTLRPLINALIKTLSDMDATVRDNSAMAIGTAMKVIGERLMMTLIADVEPIKIPKIKEFCEKAVVKKIPKAALNSINNNQAAAAPVTNQHSNNSMPPPKSSATMVRTSSSQKMKSKPGTKPAAPVTSNATVKRTATIIKRSTVSGRRVSGLPQPPQPTYHTPAPVAAAAASPAPTHPTSQMAHPLMPPPNNHAQISPPQSNFAVTPLKPVFANTIANTKITPPPTSPIDNLDAILIKLISDNDDQVIKSFNELEEFLTDDSELMFKDYVNKIIDLSSYKLFKINDTIRIPQQTNTIENSQSQVVIKITDYLIKLFARRQLITTSAEQPSVRRLLIQLFSLTQICSNNNIGDIEIITKSLNNLAYAILDGFEPASMMFILTGLLNDPPFSSIVEPVKKAIIRSMRSYK